MKSLDNFSKTVLTIAFSISMVLCSLSLLIFSFSSVPTATATEFKPETKIPWDDGLRGAVGLGIKDDMGYFVIWGNPNTFYKVDLSKARDWYE